MEASRRNVAFAIIGPIVVVALGLSVAGCGTNTGTTSTGATSKPSTVSTAAASGVVVKGLVANPATVTAADIEKMGTEKVTLQHPKNGPTQYSGVRFKKVMETLKVTAAAKTVTVTASDGFTSDVALSDVTADAFLSIDGQSVSTEFPGLGNKSWVKNVASLEFK